MGNRLPHGSIRALPLPGMLRGGLSRSQPLARHNDHHPSQCYTVPTIVGAECAIHSRATGRSTMTALVNNCMIGSGISQSAMLVLALRKGTEQKAACGASVAQ